MIIDVTNIIVVIVIVIIYCFWLYRQHFVCCCCRGFRSLLHLLSLPSMSQCFQLNLSLQHLCDLLECHILSKWWCSTLNSWIPCIGANHPTTKVSVLLCLDTCLRNCCSMKRTLLHRPLLITSTALHKIKLFYWKNYCLCEQWHEKLGSENLCSTKE